jgi:peptide/nickel transport system ATP-binding protein
MSMEKSLLEGSDAGRDEVVRVIREVGLDEEFLSRRPRHLSGGQCQRMSIARALLSHASVLLCDEITSALDVTTQAQVIKLLTEVRKAENVSIILVSHDLALVSMICDRIMVLRRGAIVDSGKTSDVIGNPSDDYTKKLLDSIIDV